MHAWETAARSQQCRALIAQVLDLLGRSGETCTHDSAHLDGNSSFRKAGSCQRANAFQLPLRTQGELAGLDWTVFASSPACFSASLSLPSNQGHRKGRPYLS